MPLARDDVDQEQAFRKPTWIFGMEINEVIPLAFSIDVVLYIMTILRKENQP
jgi:hypothetical protein